MKSQVLFVMTLVDSCLWSVDHPLDNSLMHMISLLVSNVMHPVNKNVTATPAAAATPQYPAVQNGFHCNLLLTGNIERLPPYHVKLPPCAFVFALLIIPSASVNTSKSIIWHMRALGVLWASKMMQVVSLALREKPTWDDGSLLDKSTVAKISTDVLIIRYHPACSCYMFVLVKSMNVDVIAWCEKEWVRYKPALRDASKMLRSINKPSCTTWHLHHWIPFINMRRIQWWKAHKVRNRGINL